MLKRILKRMKSDRGASSLISFMLVVPLLLGAVFMVIDFTFYNTNRDQVNAIARDAARTVAIYGGNGNATKATSIEKSYGMSRTNACSAGRSDITTSPQKYIFINADRSQMTGVECNILAAMANNTGLTSISSKVPVKVKCGPDSAPNIGSRTYCTVEYTYDSMPGNALSFIKIRNDDGTVGNPFSVNKITKSSESEVKNPTLVAR